MNAELWKAVQTKLQAKGLYKLTIDGLPGKGTRDALLTYQKSLGLQPSNPPDARTLRMMGLEPPKQSELIVPPWGVILNGKMGLHEQRDKAALQAFLKSDGSTLGDPSQLPWCGDLVETCMLNAGFGPVPGNPYLARNWLGYGVRTAPAYFAIGVAWRGDPNGFQGHVTFLVGVSADGKRYRCRGGNQQNQIGDVWMAADRFDFNGVPGFRKPATYKAALSPLPVLANTGEPLSTNEA